MDVELLLDILVNYTNEALIIVDENACIREMSKEYINFLGIVKEDAIGKHITDVVDNTRMHIILETGLPEIEEAQKINGNTVISTRIPIWKDGKVIGAFGRILFKDVRELGCLYKRINEIEQELHRYENKYGKINTARYNKHDIIGESQEIVSLRKMISKVAVSNSNIMILGESGTGKELVAHSIHCDSHRSEKPFISLNCGAIPPELLESELFGYEEGAFTGAKKGGKSGLFLAANGGTLFLDEIGDLPLNMQVKLLRVIQEREIRKVGSTVGKPIDVRVITATNKNLLELMNKNDFREDLFYRLNVVSINIPPLRMRRDDIAILAKFFIKKIAIRDNLHLESISPGAMEYLKSYDWPGNVRELENTIERASNFIDDDGIIRPEHLPTKLTGQVITHSGKHLNDILEEVERAAIVDAMMQFDRKKIRVAKELGISRTSLYEKLEKYNIDFK